MLTCLTDPYVGLKWGRGATAGTPAPQKGLLVSFTEYTPKRYRDLPEIAVAGIRLRRQLLRLPGAHGALLHAHPRSRRTGSMTAWRSEDDLQRFITLPDHLDIMARYRSRGTMRSVTFRMTGFTPGRAMAEARRRLDVESAR